MVRVAWVRSSLAAALAVAMVGSAAGGVRGQDVAPTPTPVVGPMIDEATMAQATAKGEALLTKAKWHITLKSSAVMLQVVGPTLLCRGSNLTALDIQTGRTAWTSTATFQGTPGLVPTDGGIEYVAGGVGQMSLARLGGPQGERSTVWQLNFGTPGMDGIGPTGTIAGQQVIAGGGYMFTGRGSPGRPRVMPLAIRSVDRQTGKEQWATPVEGGARSTSAPLVVGGKVYLAVNQSGDATKHFLLALNAEDGKILWRTPAQAAALFPPVVQGSLVVTAMGKGAVIAYDVNTGEEKWRSVISPDSDADKSAITSLYVTGPLFVDRDRVIVPATLAPAGPNPPRGDLSKGIFGHTAVFDLQTGKQTGYFTGIISEVRPPVNVNLEVRAVHNDVIVGALSANGIKESVGINRKTMQLEWHIPDAAVTAADGVMYVGRWVNGDQRAGTDIYAVPLDK